MTYWRKFLEAYFFHSKKGRLGVLCIAIILLLFYAYPYWFAEHVNASSIKADPVLLAAIDTLEHRNKNSFSYKEEPHQAYSPTANTEFLTAELFEFDPNTLQAEGWQKLGLKERTIKTITNYRNKGGKFYKKEDLQKIWGLPHGFYERVKDYIQIDVPQKEFAQRSFEKLPYEKKEKVIRLVNINEADTTAFIALPGIGSKLALRIINFRERLGGFYSVEQVAETYGLADSTYQKIKPFLQAGEQVKKININTATKDELKAHPYIKWNLANAIVEYRNQHGAFKSLEELKNIVLIDEETLEKLLPYLSL